MPKPSQGNTTPDHHQMSSRWITPSSRQSAPLHQLATQAWLHKQVSQQAAHLLWLQSGQPQSSDLYSCSKGLGPHGPTIQMPGNVCPPRQASSLSPLISPTAFILASSSSFCPSPSPNPPIPQSLNHPSIIKSHLQFHHTQTSQTWEILSSTKLCVLL